MLSRTTARLLRSAGARLASSSAAPSSVVCRFGIPALASPVTSSSSSFAALRRLYSTSKTEEAEVVQETTSDADAGVFGAGGDAAEAGGKVEVETSTSDGGVEPNMEEMLAQMQAAQGGGAGAAADAKDAEPLVTVDANESIKEGSEAKKMTFQAETRQILDIVANSLYTDKEVFVRELISNASDALEKARYYQTSHADQSLADADRELEIHVTLDEEANTMTIQDFGVGMTADELVTNLGTIAKSGSKAFVHDLAAKAQEGATSSEDTSNIIGQFGVGFYSSFMVGTKVDVFSQPALVNSEDAEQNKAHFWTSDGTGEYELREADGVIRGTKIIIHLREECKEFANAHKVEGIIKKYSNFVGFPIYVNGKQQNTVQAVWAKGVSEVTEEEHLAFYKYIANAYDTPTFRLHMHADVPIQIDALFYFPERHMEKYGMGRMEAGVGLYSRKILIEPKCKALLPDWLRFVQGVVDSEDISLNISRESMQDSAMIKKISGFLVKRIIKFLDTKAKNDKAAYTVWFGEFSPFIKEGVTSDFQYKDDIAKLLRYQTSSSVEEAAEEDKMSSLDDYISRMPVGQQYIYYLSAPTQAYALSSPYYEQFKKKGVEVIFMYELIDDFCMKNLHSYGGRQLVSVESAKIEDLNFDADKSEAEKKEKEAEKTGLTKAEGEELCQWFKDTLPDQVASAVLSDRLTSTPAIVVDHESAAMRRMMRQVNQGADPAPLPLQKMELNPEHPMMQQLYRVRTANPALAVMVAQQVFDNALIAADILDNPRSMMGRLNDILTYSLENATDAEVVDEGK